MNNKKHRIYRYPATDYGRMLDKEAELIGLIQQDSLSQALLLYQCTSPTVVLPAGRKWQATESVVNALNALGWDVFARRSGGAPVPQKPGIINVSHLYLWHQDRPYSVKLAYENLCAVLTRFFGEFGISVQTHATPHSYCDGDYNINIKGQKIVGTAQRVMQKKGGGKIVLAQACIIIEAALAELIAPINLCNQLHSLPASIEANAHTALAQHVETLPNVDQIFSKLTESFIAFETGMRAS